MKIHSFLSKNNRANSVRYFLLVILVLAFLFFSGDFGLVNVQKTAIVMAVGVDREADEFIVTSQIAVPKQSGQGGETKTVQLVSRGKTVAQAFSQTNAKTGWYPKLVFCRLILLGKTAVERDVFDALDFFLLDEYMPDSCLLATCDSNAKDLLNRSALIDSSGSVAMQKVLSDYAERVGLVLSTTLREFSIGYAGESRSAFMPILTTAPQQEKFPNESSSSSNTGAGEADSSGSSSGAQATTVFSAGETALFVGGKRVGKLTEAETFAFNAVKNDLKLASYSVTQDNESCTLSVRHNQPNAKFRVGKDERAVLQIRLTLTAGLSDYSVAGSPNTYTDSGDIPSWVFPNAEKKLSEDIRSAFEKCRASGCDLFQLSSFLQKYENARFDSLKDSVLQTALLDLSVRFESVR